MYVYVCVCVCINVCVCVSMEFFFSVSLFIHLSLSPSRQDLTQYNTAHNRQISVMGIPDTPKSRKRKSTSSISFAEEEEVINMEDVDPTVGRFRNMVSTTIIPKVIGASPTLGAEKILVCI